MLFIIVFIFTIYNLFIISVLSFIISSNLAFIPHIPSFLYKDISSNFHNTTSISFNNNYYFKYHQNDSCITTRLNIMLAILRDVLEEEWEFLLFKIILLFLFRVEIVAIANEKTTKTTTCPSKMLNNHFPPTNTTPPNQQPKTKPTTQINPVTSRDQLYTSIYAWVHLECSKLKISFYTLFISLWLMNGRLKETEFGS